MLIIWLINCCTSTTTIFRNNMQITAVILFIEFDTDYSNIYAKHLIFAYF